MPVFIDPMIPTGHLLPRVIGYAPVSMARVTEHLTYAESTEQVLSGEWAMV